MGKKDLERRVYTKEFKAEAVSLAGKREKPISQAAVDMGLNESMLRRWIHESHAAPGIGVRAFPVPGQSRDEELTRLRKEVKPLRDANEILKKSECTAGTGHLRARRPPVAAYQFMQANRSRYRITETAGLLGVSRGAYCQWVKHGVSERRNAALAMAVKNRPAQDGMVFHCDRGQYCAQSFRDALRTWCPAVRPSMSRKGNCWDNACAEYFFKALKRELETLDGGRSTAEARQSAFMCIEAYYNRIRMHSVLDYVAPNEYDYGKVA
jgi:transposase-like protein